MQRAQQRGGQQPVGAQQLQLLVHVAQQGGGEQDGCAGGGRARGRAGCVGVQGRGGRAAQRRAVRLGGLWPAPCSAPSAGGRVQAALQPGRPTICLGIGLIIRLWRGAAAVPVLAAALLQRAGGRASGRG